MSPFYRRSTLLIGVAALGYMVLQVLQPFWGALTWSIVLAVLFAPLQERLSAKLGHRPGVAAAFITLLTPFLVLAPLGLLGAAFLEQGQRLVDKLQTSRWRIDAQTLEHLGDYPLVGQIVTLLVEHLRLDVAQINEFVLSIGQGAIRLLGDVASGFVIGAFSTTLAFMIMLFLLYFMLRDGESMLRRVAHLLPLETQARDQILAVVTNSTRAVVYGSGLTTIIQGALTAIGFWLVDLPSPIVFGVIAALFALLPAGGTAFVWLPATLVLLALDRSGAALFMLLWGILIATSDNILRPILVSAQANVPTLAVFIGVIGGAAAFGSIGLVIGPVLLTLVAELMRLAEESQTAREE